jgi:membrane protein required for beta-lactamase induction
VTYVPRICLATGAIAAALAVAGCGGSKSPEHVVRAWSKALNGGDNEAAGALFAKDAKFVAGDIIEILRTRQEAVALNARIGWCGPIVKLAAKGGDVTARFALLTRKTARCDRGSAERGSVFFQIRDGKIVVFDQVGA